MNMRVDGSTSVNSLSAGGLSSGSIQFIFAQLQMELGTANKESALNKIEQIREQQNESKKITDAINQIRNLKSMMGDDDIDISKLGNLNVSDVDSEIAKCDKYLTEGKDLQSKAKLGEDGDATQAAANKASSGEEESTMMSVDMENYYKEQGIDYDSRGKSRRQNSDEWDRALLSLQGRKTMLAVDSICKEYNIELPSSGKLTSERLDTVIASLESSQEEVGSDIQQTMVFIQDYMGQYNSYTQGASSAISKASDTLSSIVTAR